MRAAVLKKQEEAKRERNWKPRTRWKIIQATIAWAEEQATVRRNRPDAALKEQARKLAGRGPARSPGIQVSSGNVTCASGAVLARAPERVIAKLPGISPALARQIRHALSG